MDNLDNNRIIAGFMGFEISPVNDKYVKHPKLDKFMELSTLHYDWSWNELMPVIDKIESLGFTVYITTSQCQIFDRRKESWPENFIIDADFEQDRLKNTYGAVLAFIEWYKLEENKTN